LWRPFQSIRTLGLLCGLSPLRSPRWYPLPSTQGKGFLVVAKNKNFFYKWNANILGVNNYSDGCPRCWSHIHHLLLLASSSPFDTNLVLLQALTETWIELHQLYVDSVLEIISDNVFSPTDAVCVDKFSMKEFWCVVGFIRINFVTNTVQEKVIILLVFL
jgi:hypothetical protein